jgi:ferritin-like metal-binding protein YciE
MRLASGRDAGLAACAQAVQHYEMAKYGSLIAWAKAGGHNEIVSLLEETLAEEKKGRYAAESIGQRGAQPAGVQAGCVGV